jgi:cytochrome d ubiquinol oxidase subunit I
VGHSKFFLILTGVFGTVSGVGIWFAIGFTHPEATSTLIHNFVFGWAIEWVFFLVELATAAVYYYTWNKIDAKLHLMVGWVYAGASVCTLIIINGILTFMLTPGDTWLAVAGTGHEASKFWNAFFNPTYWPSLLLRTCVCCFAGRHLGADQRQPHRRGQTAALKASLVKWSVRGWCLHSSPCRSCSMWYLLDGSRIAARAAHAGHRHHRRRHLLDVTRMALLIVITSATIIGVPITWPIAIPWTSILRTRWPFCCWR